MSISSNKINDINKQFKDYFKRNITDNNFTKTNDIKKLYKNIIFTPDILSKYADNPNTNKYDPFLYNGHDLEKPINYNIYVFIVNVDIMIHNELNKDKKEDFIEISLYNKLHTDISLLSVIEINIKGDIKGDINNVITNQSPFKFYKIGEYYYLSTDSFSNLSLIHISEPTRPY